MIYRERERERKQKIKACTPRTSIILLLTPNMCCNNNNNIFALNFSRSFFYIMVANDVYIY